YNHLISQGYGSGFGRLVLGGRRGWVKKELGIDIGNTFANNLLNSLAVTPPMRRIVIRTGDSDDADCDSFAKRFLVKELRSASVKVLSQNIETVDRHIVITKP